MTLYARRKDQRILCGSCSRGIIARIVEYPFLDGLSMEPEVHSVVLFGLGWLPRSEDGVWTLTPHAAKQARLYGPTLHRVPKVKTGSIFDQSEPGQTIVEHFAAQLPVDAMCSRCGTRQTLDVDQLGVSEVLRRREDKNPVSVIGLRPRIAHSGAIPFRRPKEQDF